MDREHVSGTRIRAPAAVLEQYGMMTWCRLTKRDGGTCLVLGTAHTGLAGNGAKQVQRLIQHEAPDVVGIELDYGRLLQMVPERMRPRAVVPDVLRDAPRIVPTLPQLAVLLPAQLMASVLGCINDDESYGADMVTAASEARARGAAAVMLDRPVLTTLARTRSSWLDLLTPDMSSILLSAGLLSRSRAVISRGVDRHLEEEHAAMEPHLPSTMADACLTFRKTLSTVYREGKASALAVDALRTTLPVELEACNIAYRRGGLDADQLDSFLLERDRVLALTIRTMPGTRTVAVVGAGHVAGIVQHFQRLEEMERLIDPEEVMAAEEEAVRALLQPLPYHRYHLFGPPLALLAGGALALARIGRRSKWLAAGVGVAAVTLPALALLRMVKVAYAESAYLGRALQEGRAGNRAEED